MASLYRIFVIGRITLTEAVRQKVLSVLFLFGLVLVGCSVFISGLANPGLDAAGLFDEQIKFVKDFGCGAIDWFGLAIAILSTAQLIPQELHNRTIYTILSKPVRRAEFLLGKFFGIVLLLALCTALMSLAFAAALYWQETIGMVQTEASYAQGHNTWDKEKALVSQYNEEIKQANEQTSAPRQLSQKIDSINAEFKHNTPNWEAIQYYYSQYDHDVAVLKSQVRDPQLIEAILLIFIKLIMVTSIALLLSTFATSPIFTIITSMLIYLIGLMEGVAREYWLAHGAGISIWQSALVGLVSLLTPDMNSFTIVDEILSGHHIPWSHALHLLGYADVYIIVVLAVSVVIFDYREI